LTHGERAAPDVTPSYGHAPAEVKPRNPEPAPGPLHFRHFKAASPAAQID
jgi:hypothetical protein